MAAEQRTYLAAADLNHPLLERLSDITSEFAHMRLSVVFPQADGWGQVLSGGPAEIPEFCRLIQGTKEGAKHCRMCHILMAIAACAGQTNEQRCHAGTSVLVSPMGNGEDSLAVLSTCVFVKNGDRDAWEEAKACGRKLGLKISELKKAFNRLPRLDAEELKLARRVMAAAGEAVAEIRKSALLEAKMAERQETRKDGPDVQATVEERLRTFITDSGPQGQTKHRDKTTKTPALITVVSALVNSKPAMSYTVSEIAAAARMTPNHFSSLFRQHTGQNFSAFLTQKRMELARKLLGDLTLNIAEVAVGSGYGDPGYFARVFKKEMGVSPREWRQSPGSG